MEDDRIHGFDNFPFSVLASHYRSVEIVKLTDADDSKEIEKVLDEHQQRVDDVFVGNPPFPHGNSPKPFFTDPFCLFYFAEQRSHDQNHQKEGYIIVNSGVDLRPEISNPAERDEPPGQDDLRDVRNDKAPVYCASLPSKPVVQGWQAE